MNDLLEHIFVGPIYCADCRNGMSVSLAVIANGIPFACEHCHVQMAMTMNQPGLRQFQRLAKEFTDWLNNTMHWNVTIKP